MVGELIFVFISWRRIDESGEMSEIMEFEKQIETVFGVLVKGSWTGFFFARSLSLSLSLLVKLSRSMKK